MYKEIKGFQTWKEIRDFIDELDTKWIFRGQQDCNWSLTTGMDRLLLGIFDYDKNTFKQQVENRMIDRLNRHLHNIPQYSSLLTSNIQKIAFLQHYGAPTRLLDFTISPYVALFFAIENATDDSAMYAINYAELNIRNKILFSMKQDPERLSGYLERGSLSDPEWFDKVVIKSPQYKFVDAIQPYYKFDRLINQSGMFLCQGDINISFEDNLKETLTLNLNKPEAIHKIFIPIGLREEILGYLINKMNINRSTLFPGIDGFVQSLSLSVMTDLNDSVSYVKKMNLNFRPPNGI